MIEHENTNSAGDAVIEARGYRTVTDRNELTALRFTPKQARPGCFSRCGLLMAATAFTSTGPTVRVYLMIRVRKSWPMGRILKKSSNMKFRNLKKRLWIAHRSVSQN